MDAATRSRIMGRIRGSNTKPELLLRRALHATGMRYRIHDRSVPGTPDVSHKGAKLAVLIDGCFWHGCPDHYKRPSSRQDFWDSKLAYNQDLRRRVKDRLDADGWRVLEIWECQVRADSETWAQQVAQEIRSRRLK